MKQAFDVAVVGAGPAGSAAAYYLAQAGWRVVVLERSVFPRDKACGDGLTPGAMALLADMGLGGEMMRHRPIAGMRVVTGRNGHRDQLFRGTQAHDGTGTVIPRRELDQLVARRAVEAGAVLRQKTPVLGPLWADGRVAGVRVAQAKGEAAIHATFVVAADGALSPFAAQAGLLPRDRAATGFAARTYVSGVTALEPLFHCYVPLVDPATNRRLAGYGWIFPLGAGLANIGVGFSPSGERDPRSNLRRVFEAFVARLRETDGRFRDMDVIGRCEGAPLFHGVDASRCAGRNTLLVGDAAGLVDPITGEGIDRALESGKLAAAVLDEALASPHPDRADLEGYRRLIETRFGARARARRKLARMHRFVSELVEHTLTIDTPLFDGVRRDVIGYSGHHSSPPRRSVRPGAGHTGIDAAAVREQVVAAIDEEFPLLSRTYADIISVEDTSLKTELALETARYGHADVPALTTAITAIELAQLGVAVHRHMSGLGALPRSATSRESAQWSNIFTVMAGDYLLMRAHATVSHLGPRVGATMGDALARSYRRLMQTAGGPADVAIFHALTCRLAGIIAGVPDAVIDELASRIDGPATPPVPYCASSTATRCT